MPLVALCLTVLMGAAALAVDAGYLQYKQRVQQTASDAAAIAGAWQLVDHATSAQVKAAGLASATSNSFTDGSNNVSVTINWAPQSGPNKGNTNAVEAIISAEYPAIFSSIWTKTNSVTTRAVAIVQSNQSTPCFYVMDKDLTMSAPGSTLTSSCGILVNRNVNDNNAVMNVPSIGAGSSFGNTFPGVVTTIVPPFNDPCSTIPGCAALVSMFPLNSNVANEGPYSSCGPEPSNPGPGCYTSLPNDANLTPGLYVVTGDVSGNLTCTTCTSNGTSGTGVTIVVGGKVNFNGSTSSLVAPPKATGTGTATVTSTGGAPGVVFYMTSTQTSPQNFSAQSLLGMIYAPNAHINLNGGGSTLHVTFVVAADVIANKAQITVDNSGFSNLSQTPVLAE